MARRLLLSCCLGMVTCGLCFYLFNFLWLIYASATGQLNPTNSPGVQLALRHYALPASLALGLIVFWAAFGRSGKQS